MPKKTDSRAAEERRPRGVDLAEVEQLLAFMERHGLEEFEYERDGVRVRLKKPGVAPAGGFPAQAVYEPHRGAAHAVAAPAAQTHPAAAEPSAPKGEDLHVIKSPIVGTFYSAANPGSDPFVKIGDRVDSGQVLCIIEAMKLMNEIESDVAGEIVKVFAENGQPVEYGEALFGVRAQGKK